MNNSDIISKENRARRTVFIVGPTSSGKTEIAHTLAKKIGRAEIISADSMQVYKKMDIITAKPAIEYRWELPYHLVDFVDVASNYSASDFYDDAIKSIGEIFSNGKIPIIVGGTGLYIRTLLKGIFDCPCADWNFRSEMQEFADTHGVFELHKLLKERDCVAAANIEPQNVRRVIRALEVHHLTGTKISDLQNNWNKPLGESHPIMGQLFLWGIYWPRQIMYERINSRVDHMIDQGLIDEVKNLIDIGIMSNNSASQAIGIKEISNYLSGIINYKDAVELIKRNTRRFAKRQLTWFAKEDNFKWFIAYNNEYKLKILNEMIKEL